MTRLLSALIAFLACVPAYSGDVSASIGVSQPGFYGQINIGNLPRPAVIYAQPVWIERPRKVVAVQPVYLHVPPGHEKHWAKHCGKYGACGRPVLFVREDWYQTHYALRHERRDQDNHGNGGANQADAGHVKNKAEGNGSGSGNGSKGKGR